MRSDTTGPITTFLLFVPLVAVPLLAVFGIPQFAPVVASPESETVIEPEGSLRQGERSGAGGSASAFSDATGRARATPPFVSDERISMDSAYAEHPGDVWRDPFRPLPQPVRRENDNALAAHSPEPWTPPPGALDEWETQENRGAAGPAEGRVAPSLTEQADHDNGGSRPQNKTRSRWGEKFFAPGKAAASGPPRDIPPRRHPDAFLPLSDSQRRAENDAIEPLWPGEDAFAGVNTAGDPSLASHQAGEQAGGNAREFDFAEPPSRFVKEDSVGGGTQSPTGQTKDESATQSPLAKPLTWRAAVGRLNALGIRHFQLEPGQRDDFHFSCYFTPRDNPRITHRFEAEANEPLPAVEKVLAQVEQWLKKR